MLEEHAERVGAPATRPCARAVPSRKAEIVDEQPSPSPSIVSTVHAPNPEAHAAAAACASWWSTSCSRRAARARGASCAEATRDSPLGTPRPGDHSVMPVLGGARQRGQQARPHLPATDGIVALLGGRPPPPERLGRVGGARWRRRRLPRHRGRPDARHAAMERVGKRTSSLRRVNRSSLTATPDAPVDKQRGPGIVPVPDPKHVHGCVSGAADSPSRCPRTPNTRYLHGADQPGSVAAHAPDADVRGPVRPPMLVARHFGHPEPATQGLDDHLLLDGGDVLAQVELRRARPSGSPGSRSGCRSGGTRNAS